MTDDFSSDFMEIFAFETNQFLEDLERILIDNENNKEGIKAAVPEIFRIMHTIKSSSAMMSLDNISKMAHKIEDLFFYIRENNPQYVDYVKLTDIVLDCVDFIKRSMQNGAKEDPSKKIEYVGKFLEELKKPPTAEQTDVLYDYIFTVFFKENCQMLGLRAFELQSKLERQNAKVIPYPENPDENEDIIKENGFILDITSTSKLEEIKSQIMKSAFVDKVIESSEQIFHDDPEEEPEEPAKTKQVDFSEILKQTEPAAEPAAKKAESSMAPSSFVNVSTSKLDYLVDLVGEIIVAEMELSREISVGDSESIGSSLSNLKKLIFNMQDAALSTRMIPMKETFRKMQRIIRDINRKQNKDIVLITTGEDTEVDRNLTDSISAALMHVIRNSADHGIETAEERQKQGKSSKGKIELSAKTEGRNIIITVTDDGGGLDKEKILSKAISNGIIDIKKAVGITEAEIYNLIFLPGFSTKKDVTEFSGRGVGMDVVHENISKMHGKVSVISKAREGTTVSFIIPLTLAIIDAIIIKVGSETCAVPMGTVSEMLKLEDLSSIRRINGEDVVLLRDECYKIVDLTDLFTNEEKRPYDEGIMLVVKNEIQNFVLFANDVVDRLSVVVKPVPEIFKSIRGISGCTILGDGRISLILDAQELRNISRKDEDYDC